MAQQQQPQAVPAQLDRTAFAQVLRVPALRVPKQRCQELMRKLRGFTLDVPKVRCIVHDGEREDVRLLLLRQELDPEALSPEVQAVLEPHPGVEVVAHDVHLDYSHLSAEAVLKKLLPDGVEVPSSFEAVGHIAHFNLRPEVMAYKHVIGQVILDKNPIIKTVVNKLGQIENEFRVFEMEVIAGEPRFEAEVSQHGTRFRLDFSKVYWNSRLEAEHSRLVGLFKPGEVVADIMAGIGPFAVPAGLRGCRVYANDLNPDSAQYLNLNIQLNKVTGQVTPFNMDGRRFVRLLLATPGGPADQLGPQQQEVCGAQQPAQQQQQQEQQQQQQAQQQQAQQQQAQQQQAQQQQAQAQQQQQQQQQQAKGPLQEQQPAQQQQQQAEKQPEQQQQQQPQTGGADGSAAKGRSRQQHLPKRKLAPQVPPAMPPGFRPPSGGVLFEHAVMNLPASAVEFLDAFRGAFDPAAWAQRALPMVHVYTFQKSETQQDVIRRVEAALGGPLDEAPAVHVVRDVAPNKLMLCVSFRVPQAVAFHGRLGDGALSGAGEPPLAKKAKV